MAKRDFLFERPEDSTGFLLWQVTNLWQRELKKALQRYHLTHAQFVLMASIHWLTHEQQKVTQIALAHHTKVDPMTTSTVVRTLQKKGLIRREEHETDTRAKTVVPTEAGLKIIKQAIKTVEQFDKDFFTSLGSKAKDFNHQLTALLTNGHG